MRKASYLARILASAAALAGFAFGATEPEILFSPDGQTRVTIAEDQGQFTYAVRWQDQDIVLPSRLELGTDTREEIARVERSESDTTWKPAWGQWSEIRDHHHAMVLHLRTSADEEILLECRVFDDGLGLRFSSGGKPLASVEKVDFRTAYRWPEKSAMYWANGERDPVGPVTLSAFAQDAEASPHYPVVVDLGEERFAAALESDLFSASQFSALEYVRSGDDNGVLVGSSAASVQDQIWQTPWRVIVWGRSPGDLLTTTTALNLAAPNQLADTSWIKPGKMMWDWRVHGYQAGDFTYGINTESYLRFIDFAADNNIPYFLIDADWFATAKDGDLEISPGLDLPKTMARARERGVGVLLYYDRHKGVLENDALFPQLARHGAVGTKYGFMGNDAAFTRGAITAAAQQKLLVNFHDKPVPMTGAERTMPNAITREYCHAQQDSRRAFTPTGFLKMAMINALSGPLDQANGVFGLNGVNAGEREKGPKIRESFNSTVVSEAARVLVIYSGLICLPDAPEEYAKKADLFEFIRRMPATWDETRILNSRIGEHITTARRSRDQWFIGSVMNEAGGELSIPLGFLDPHTSYDVTSYEDAPDSHYINNREAYRISHDTVERGDTIQARLAPGGGQCLWIRPRG